ncbi:hypothetical protein NSQ43_00390 [Sporosarcina sp. FSL W8-0480]|uniref:hypothetical protein n=1 Tax=Sporosarcina sp. FSL W8-0480 TaxID=2954701 RepID=UPI0030D8B71F
MRSRLRNRAHELGLCAQDCGTALMNWPMRSRVQNRAHEPDRCAQDCGTALMISTDALKKAEPRS